MIKVRFDKTTAEPRGSSIHVNTDEAPPAPVLRPSRRPRSVPPPPPVETHEAPSTRGPARPTPTKMTTTASKPHKPRALPSPGPTPLPTTHTTVAGPTLLHHQRTKLLTRNAPPMAIPEMDTISEEEPAATGSGGPSSPTAAVAEWRHDPFYLNDRGEVWNRETHTKITKDEVRAHGEGIMPGLIEYVHTRMLREFQFLEQAIPALDLDEYGNPSSVTSASSSFASSSSSVRSSSSSICSTADGFRTMVDSDVPRCIFHTSEDYSIAERLLVFVCSSRGLSCGIWSRSMLLQEGVHVGSMIPYFHAARQAGYGILVMNPNMNTQTMLGADGEERKLPIQGSATQEEHCEHVWQHYIFPSAAHKIHFIAFGYGGVLVTNLIDKYKNELRHRLGNVAYIESSHKVDPRWSPGFRRFLSQHSICWRRSSESLNSVIAAEAGGGGGPSGGSGNSPRGTNDGADELVMGHHSSVGCLCLSAGMDLTGPSSPALTTKAVLSTVFKFLASPSAYEFHRMISKEVRRQAMAQNASSPTADKTQGRLRRASSAAAANGSSRGDNSRRRAKETVTLDDFELLRVVGRGAFGKVMLVRRKPSRPQSTGSTHFASELTGACGNGGSGGGKVYAMKVIKKAAVFAKNQVEHTKTERRILEGVDHPFAVKLRYAFQNDAKLFFVMDYYNGGTLHFHLRHAKRFDIPRARFYAAQIVSALGHLHTYGIVYRDLKPENILMDHEGFIALTDFGLSSDHYDAKGEGLQTFCGTPEYIAPELIRREPYGRAADYWSLGIMMYEMIAGYTPFYHSNRKRNFENIVRMPLRFPHDTFTDDAKALVRGLLSKDPAKRLGSGPMGAAELMEHPFFATIDWERLYRRDVPVPFRPMVKRDGDLSNIPEFFKRQDVLDSAPDATAPIDKRNVFQDFTYVDPFPMA